KHEAARSVLVEAMRQHRGPRQAESQRIERSFQIGAALRPAMHRQPRRLVDDQHQSVAMEHTRLDFFCRQLRNIEQWQDFRLQPETANTPRCGGFGIRSVVAANGQANAKSKAALATISGSCRFRFEVPNRTCGKSVGTSNRRHERNERYSGSSQAELV